MSRILLFTVFLGFLLIVGCKPNQQAEKNIEIPAILISESQENTQNAVSPLSGAIANADPVVDIEQIKPIPTSTPLITIASPEPKNSQKIPTPTPTMPVNSAGTLTVPILMYHYIGELPPKPDSIRKGLTVSQSNFEAQMRLLAQRGYSTISLEDLTKALKTGQKLPSKPVLLTFDDGYEDNFRAAYPVLKQNRFTGTFFIITDFVGRPGYMTWDQLRMLSAESMEIGSHTRSHPDLSTASQKVATEQIRGSKEILEKQLGKGIVSFCYPAGKYTAATVSLLQESGYQAAVTTKNGSSHQSSKLLELTRLRVSGDTSLASFAALLGEKAP